MNSEKWNRAVTSNSISRKLLTGFQQHKLTTIEKTTKRMCYVISTFWLPTGTEETNPTMAASEENQLRAWSVIPRTGRQCRTGMRDMIRNRWKHLEMRHDEGYWSEEDAAAYLLALLFLPRIQFAGRSCSPSTTPSPGQISTIADAHLCKPRRTNRFRWEVSANKGCVKMR